MEYATERELAALDDLINFLEQHPHDKMAYVPNARGALALGPYTLVQTADTTPTVPFSVTPALESPAAINGARIMVKLHNYRIEKATMRWEADCPRCEASFEFSPTPEQPEPSPHGTFCPNCREQKYLCLGILHFKKRRVLAPL